MRALLLLFVLLISMIGSVRGNHLMGGQITWDCLGGGDYEFFLHIYRDCNGSAAPSSANLDVWNHPSVNAIPLSLQSQNDISLDCQPVAGGPSEVTCASGGTGAVEEVVFSSGPVSLPGTPPAQGWGFTWDGISRSSSIDNLQNPGAYGITLRAIMYEYNGQNASPCFDNSPRFGQKPLAAVCTGNSIKYNANPYDPDGDSISVSWAQPLEELSGTFNPPTDPSAIPLETGYSMTSPFPGTSQDPNNIPATLDGESGSLEFTSFTQGEFVHVMKVTSWRNGEKIAEVFREYQMVIGSCSNNNDPPVVPPPFNAGNSYLDTVYAGQQAVFNFTSSDNQQLQDGSQQTVTLSPSGMMFGDNFNDATTGCPDPPCATLSDPMPLSGQNGVSTSFDWQTECIHLENANGNVQPSRTFWFVFRVGDDYCDVPGVEYTTVGITVLDNAEVGPPSFRCLSVNGNDAELSWEKPSNTSGFDSYHIFRSTSPNGPFTVVDSIFNVNQETYTDLGAIGGGGPYYYFIRSRSGCSGSTFSAPSDTLRTIHLQANDPGNGYAKLKWNKLVDPPNLSTSNGYYRLYREYPIGTWSLIDSVPYGTEEYQHEITVCNDTMSFRVEIEDASGCVSVSSIDGSTYRDLIAPTTPLLGNVSVDTSNGKAVIDWEASPEADTKGYYVIQNINGTDYVIDTVWGRTNTIYQYNGSNAGNKVESYGIAAFDSCITGIPPTPNTSAAGSFHNSMDVEGSLNTCKRSVDVTWNEYVNWDAGVVRYEVYSIQNGTVNRIGTVADTTHFEHEGVDIRETYCYVVVAVSGDGREALSNKHCQYIDYPEPPDFLYLNKASVEEEKVRLQVTVGPTSSRDAIYYKILRSTDGQTYDTVDVVDPIGGNQLNYVDPNANPNERSYYYKVIASDSCQLDMLTSNQGRTIYLTTYADSDQTINTLQWNRYRNWDGYVDHYNIYRSVNGQFQETPIASVPASQFVYEDQVGDLVEEEGEFCYYIEAVEKDNTIVGNAKSLSNVSCAFQEPKFFIPNAFMVGGHNDIFKPVAGYIDLDFYYFAIHNRWGKKIFQTNKVDKGWDGTYNDNLVKEGAYVYHFKYRTAEGRLVERRGTVMLLKNK